jgi:HEPN domain-containing protein
LQRARDWLKESQAELAAARDLVAGGHWSWSCFTCQQAAEKAIKAMAEHFRIAQSGHNLNTLLRAIEPQITIPAGLRTSGARLNRYYIPARYPDAFPQGAPAEQYFESDAREALNDAEGLYQFAEGVIGPP